MAKTDEDLPPEPPPPAARRPLVLAALAGFVLGGGVLGLLWALSGTGDGAAEDARAACAAFTRVGTLPNGRDSNGADILDPTLLHRVAAARELSAAAAELSPAYRELAEHLDGVSRMVISLNFADPAGQRHVARATELCGQV